MKRLKSIDIVRGLSICWMIFGHTMDWWLIKEDRWYYLTLKAYFDFLGAGTFIFISGVSIMISYKSRMLKTNNTEGYNEKMVNIEYLNRAWMILIVALGFNIFVAIWNLNPLIIWSWFILLTIAISLFMAWPLLKTSKLLRIFIGSLIFIANQILLSFLLPYAGQSNIYGLLFYILFNPLNLNPILAFFPFFLCGTVVGDLIFEVHQICDINERRMAYKKKIIFPILIIGIILIIFGVIYQFPAFYLEDRSFSWLIWALGLELTCFIVLLSIEEFEIIKTKKSFKFLYYFSFYSFTVYISHMLLYFVFLGQIQWYYLWIYQAITIILIGLLLRYMHKKSGPKYSLKYQIGRLSIVLTKKINEKT